MAKKIGGYGFEIPEQNRVYDDDRTQSSFGPRQNAGRGQAGAPSYQRNLQNGGAARQNVGDGRGQQSVQRNARVVSTQSAPKIQNAGSAGLTEKVKSLPQGLETHIGREVHEDGIFLSGGETQRLMLARALYKNAPIIVLDEPTAALDPLAENDLYQKYSDLTDGRTSLYISHRLASTRFCNRILYLEKGVIAEEGSHKELLKKGGKYAELFEIQSRYYKEGVDICEETQLG